MKTIKNLADEFNRLREVISNLTSSQENIKKSVREIAIEKFGIHDWVYSDEILFLPDRVMFINWGDYGEHSLMKSLTFEEIENQNFLILSES